MLEFSVPDAPYGWMSNASRHCLAVTGTRYATAEHCLAHRKALAFGDADTAARILRAQTPADAAALASGIRGYVEPLWACIRLSVLRDVVLLKVRQHPELARLLYGTGQQYIAYVSPDDLVLGCARCEKTGRFHGENLLGFAWMQVGGVCLCL